MVATSRLSSFPNHPMASSVLHSTKSAHSFLSEWKTTRVQTHSLQAASTPTSPHVS